MKPIYLDNNATTAIHPEVAAAMQQCYSTGAANPASQHSWGRQARKLLEEARDGIAELLGAEIHGMASDRLIFTSGGTESNNLALRGLVGHSPGRIIISAIEHPSVVGSAEYLATCGCQLVRLAVDNQGVVRKDQFPDLLTADTRLVSVMLGNNETGVLQPIADIAAIGRAHRVFVHTDAAQAVGKIPVTFRALNVDALSFSAHKFHGPVGIGGLLVRHGVPLDPILFGGFQQAGLRPGTEPLALVVGLFEALRICQRDSSKIQVRVAQLRDRLAERLRAGWPQLVVVGEGAPRLPHTLNVAFPGVDRQALVMALDMAGVACSTGSACASGSSEPSPILLAMGLPGEVVGGSIRLSLSAVTSESEVDEAACRILHVVNDLHRKSGLRRAFLPPRVASAKSI